MVSLSDETGPSSNCCPTDRGAALDWGPCLASNYLVWGRLFFPKGITVSTRDSDLSIADLSMKPMDAEGGVTHDLEVPYLTLYA